MENNNAVFNYFRFFGYYLSFVDLFTVDYPYLKIKPHQSLPLSPRLEEKTWRPVKLNPVAVDAPAVDVNDDKELFDNSLFY